MVDGGTTSRPAGRRNWIIAAGVVVAVAVVVVIAGFAFLGGQPSGGASALSRVTITPDASGDMEVGESRGFNATAYDQNGRTLSGATFTWSLAQNRGTLYSTTGNHTSFSATTVGAETLRVNASVNGLTKSDTAAVSIIAFMTMGISLSTSADGQNWILTVTYAPPGRPYTGENLAIFHPNGTANLSATPLASLQAAVHGCTLNTAFPGSTTVKAGDRILCSTYWYATDSTYQISDRIGIRAAGTLR
jgi:hypothetical protein